MVGLKVDHKSEGGGRDFTAVIRKRGIIALEFTDGEKKELKIPGLTFFMPSPDGKILFCQIGKKYKTYCIGRGLPCTANCSEDCQPKAYN